MLSTLPYIYNEYKRRSTLYRIASLLGWMRAINIELSTLPRGTSDFLVPITGAFNRVQSAMADGPHVEIYRLEQLCAVWRIDIAELPKEEKENLAADLETELHRICGPNLKEDTEHLASLSDTDKKTVCTQLSSFLCTRLNLASVQTKIISETKNSAIRAMSYRGALIYRDWQDAIGESMLESDKDSMRRFRIVGYEKFSAIIDQASPWMIVFRELIDNIDFKAVEPNDFRGRQLKHLAAAVSEIAISLSKTDERDLIDDQTLEAAKKLLSLAKPTVGMP